MWFLYNPVPVVPIHRNSGTGHGSCRYLGVKACPALDAGFKKHVKTPPRGVFSLCLIFLASIRSDLIFLVLFKQFFGFDNILLMNKAKNIIKNS